MLFNEVYGSYYKVIAAILTESVSGELTDKRISEIIREKAFGESVLTIPTSLRDGSWPLLTRENATPLEHTPSMSTTSAPIRISRKCLSLFSPLRSKTRYRRANCRKRCISSPIWSLTAALKVPEQRTSNMPKASLPRADMNCPVLCSGTWPAATGSNPSLRTNRVSRSYPAAPRASSPCCKAGL